MVPPCFFRLSDSCVARKDPVGVDQKLSKIQNPPTNHGRVLVAESLMPLMTT